MIRDPRFIPTQMTQGYIYRHTSNPWESRSNLGMALRAIKSEGITFNDFSTYYIIKGYLHLHTPLKTKTLCLNLKSRAKVMNHDTIDKN